MKKNIKLLSILLLVLFTCTMVGCSSTPTKTEEPQAKAEVQGPKGDKKGIIVVSFGTTYPETRAVTIEAIEKQIGEEFSDYEVRRVFTSNIIRKVLKDRDGIVIDTLQETLDKMHDEGFGEIIVQPTHLMNGEEYNGKIYEVAMSETNQAKFNKLVVGRALLSTLDDYKAFVAAIESQTPEVAADEAVVFMGHGTPHYANSAYSQLQLLLNDEPKNMFVGTVEGYPELDDVIARLKENKIKKVTLMPLMVVAGDHANNDMAGDEEDSWKTILKQEGFEVEIYLHGLGENAQIRQMYVNNLQDAIDGMPLGYTVNKY